MKPSGRVEVAFPAVFYSFSTADWSGWRYNVCASQLLLCQPQTGEVFLWCCSWVSLDASGMCSLFLPTSSNVSLPLFFCPGARGWLVSSVHFRKEIIFLGSGLISCFFSLPKSWLWEICKLGKPLQRSRRRGQKGRVALQWAGAVRTAQLWQQPQPYYASQAVACSAFCLLWMLLSADRAAWVHCQEEICCYAQVKTS